MTLKTRTDLKAENATDFPDNTNFLISPAGLRGQMDDTADSMLMREDIPVLDLSQANVTATSDGTKTLAAWTRDIVDGVGGGGGSVSVQVVTITEATYTLSSVDHNTILDCINISGCVVTVPLGLTSDTGAPFTCEIGKGEGGGNVHVKAGAGCIVEAPNDFVVMNVEFGLMRLVEWPDGSFRLYDGTAIASGVAEASGASLLFYADQYDAVNKAIPNAAQSSTPISANIYRASRRLFARIEFWARGGTATITDDAAAGPDGTDNDASTVDMSGAWYIRASDSRSLPAGTYTVAVKAKRNTGSDQSFCFSKDNGATRSPVKVATASWQSFTYAFTLATPALISYVLLCSIDGVTAANLQIRDLELHPGDVSATWAPQAYVGHAYFGLTALDTRPAYAAGAMDLSTGGYAFVQAAQNTTIGATGITAIGLVSRVAAGSAYQSFLSKVQASGDFTAASSISEIPVDFTQVKFANAPAPYGLWSTLGKGYHCFAHRYDGVSRDFWLDDLRVAQKFTTVPDFSIRDFFLGAVDTPSQTSGYKLSIVGLWPRALTDAEIRTTVASFQARAAASGITATSINRFVMFEGDSRTDSATQRWPYKFGPNAAPVLLASNFAIGGTHFTELNARIGQATGLPPPGGVGTGRKLIGVVGQMGANDLASYPGATDTIAAQNYANDMGIYTDALWAAGYTDVIVCTELPALSSGVNVHNTRKTILNNIYKTAYPGTHPVVISDFAADAIMGPDNSYSVNPTYWVDPTHQSLIGDDRFEAIIRPIINGITDTFTTAPVNTIAPATTGAIVVGSVLSVTTGTWAGTPSGYAYQWKRAGSSIGGATTNGYTLVTADIGAMISCAVTATNSYGSTAAASNALGPVADVPGGGVEAGGALLLTDETTGFAVDFAYAVDANRVAVKV